MQDGVSFVIRLTALIVLDGVFSENLKFGSFIEKCTVKSTKAHT